MIPSRLRAARVAALVILGFAAGIMPALATAPKITSFAPPAGSIGATVTVTGTGFLGAKSVKVNNVAATFKVVSGVKLTLTVPVTGSTGFITVTTPGGTGKSTTKFTMEPGLALSPVTGMPSSTVTVSGAGFQPYRAVDLYFDTTDLVLVVTNARGEFSVKIQVPSSAQPGAHWITGEERVAGIAAQKSFNVSTDWPMQGFAISGRSNNPNESTITAANVSGLTTAWAVTRLTSPNPVIELQGDLFVTDGSGTLRAYSSAGHLLWTASTGASGAATAPAGYDGLIFAAGASDTVYAYKAACRGDGGVCSPTWTKNIGVAITASPTIYRGQVYVPGGDGNIHPLAASTGAVGTPFHGIDTNEGAITQPVAVDADGTAYYVTGTYIQYTALDGLAGYTNYGVTVSPVAAFNGPGYVTSGNGKLDQFIFGWSVPTSGTGCQPGPAIADSMIFAGGCTSLAAYDSTSGAVDWSVTTTTPVIGLSVAGNVLYACLQGGLEAFNFSGAKLWTGGSCNAAPTVVNGTVYAVNGGELIAYDLPGAGGLPVAAPNPRKLRPDPRLRPRLSSASPVSMR